MLLILFDIVLNNNTTEKLSNFQPSPRHINVLQAFSQETLDATYYSLIFENVSPGWITCSHA